MSELVAVRNNESENRFETVVDGMIAIAEYRLGDGEITFTHTEVPVALEGRGIGAALARTALDHARVRCLRVVPRCPFIRSYIERHAEYADLVDA